MIDVYAFALYDRPRSALGDMVNSLGYILCKSASILSGQYVASGIINFPDGRKIGVLQSARLPKLPELGE